MSVPVYDQAPTIGNRPMGRTDAQGRVIPDSFVDESFRGAYSGTNLIYKGFARPGAAEDAPVWQLAKLAYDGSDNLLSIKWPQDANGKACNDYQFQWSARAGYTYS